MFFSRIILPSFLALAAVVSATPYPGDYNDFEIRSYDDYYIVVRALPVTFKQDVHDSTNKADRKKLTSVVRGFHNSLPDTHVASGAASAHVWKTTHTSPEDPRPHVTVDFKDANGGHITTKHIPHSRRALPVTFKQDVHDSTNKADRKKLTSVVRGFHNSLPDTHVASGAASAHVWKTTHTSPEDPRPHVTVDFKDANGGHITTKHIPHSRRGIQTDFSDHAYSTTNKNDRKFIKSSIHSHVNSLPDSHAAKKTDYAWVRNGPHTSESDSRLHSTVDLYHGNNFVTTHHIIH